MRPFLMSYSDFGGCQIEETKKYGPNERTEKETPDKELSDMQLANLSDAEFVTLVMRMLREITEYNHKIKEEVKAIQSEINESIQGTNSEGKETGTHINKLEQKEEINIHPEQKEETRILKNRGEAQESLR